MTIAGLAVAVIVWGLILWAVIAYRRRDPDKMPRQFHANMPLEVLYTVMPLIIVGVIFFYTVVGREQDRRPTRPTLPSGSRSRGSNGDGASST